MVFDFYFFISSINNILQVIMRRKLNLFVHINRMNNSRKCNDS